jgi:hypothetical protein
MAVVPGSQAGIPWVYFVMGMALYYLEVIAVAYQCIIM